MSTPPCIQWTAPKSLFEDNSRRIKTIVYASYLAALMSAGFVAFDLAVEMVTGAFINALATIIYLVAARGFQTGKEAVCRHLIMLTGNLHLLFLISLAIGPERGAQYFFIASAVTALPMFRLEGRGWMFFYVGLATSGLMLTELRLLPFPEDILGVEAGFYGLMRTLCASLTTLFVFLVMRRYLSLLDEAQAVAEREFARSEELLLNILPPTIASRLKNGEAVTDAYEEVTVLFADIVSFTNFAATTSPKDLVEILNTIFSAFDEMAERHGLEKIKTIGDAYMAASGIPDPCNDHAHRMARMALEMSRWIEEFRKVRQIQIGLRVGIHTGPVVAGIIGTKKFIYDLWGDTVNLASRMESHGAENSIQVSAQTHAQIQESFILEPRGLIDVKGRGQVEAYWLKGLKD